MLSLAAWTGSDISTLIERVIAVRRPILCTTEFQTPEGRPHDQFHSSCRVRSPTDYPRGSQLMRWIP
jgi:hypothetical protein